MVVSFLAAVAAAYLAVVALAYFFQRGMMYFPGGGGVPAAADYLANGEDVTLETGDGLSLGAWYLRGPEDGGLTVVVFNGNAGDRTLRALLGEAIAAAGHAVLMVDYRGYGGNPGRPSEAGLIADARAARAWLETREDSSRRVVYFGESLGAAVAVALAAEVPPDGLVLRSPFTSAVEVARHHYPILPVRWLLRDPFPSEERIAGVSCPVLVIAGEKDRIVPPRFSRKLYEAAPGPKAYVEIEGADHNDAEFLIGDRFLGELLGFLERIERGEEPA